MMKLNDTILLALHNIVAQGGPFADLVYWIADRLDVWVIAFLLLWFLHRAWKKHLTSQRLFCFSCFHEVIMVMLTGILAWSASALLKVLLTTLRPFAIESLSIIPLFVPVDPWAFPSGHAALFVALGLITWFHDRVAGTVALIAGTLIALARVMAGVHFPIDIVGGALVAGIVVGSIMYFDNQHLHHIQ